MKTLLLSLGWLLVTALHAQAEDTRAEFWIDLLFAEPIDDLEDMWSDLRDSDVVYLGETHRLERHHKQQVAVLKELLKGDRPVILGLEQIETRNQPDLDRYNAGEIDFDEFAKVIEWEKQWRGYQQYREAIETAQKAGARVVGLNGPREIIREVGQIGVDALAPEKRKLLPEKIHTDDPTYEKLMNQMLSIHSNFDPKFLRNVFEAQVSRDDSMADSLVKALQAVEGEKKPIGVVIAGGGHVQFGLGTPDRVAFRLPDIRARILLMSESGDLVLSPMEKAMKRAIEFHHEDLRFIRRPIADYLYVKEWNPKADDED